MPGHPNSTKRLHLSTGALILLLSGCTSTPKLVGQCDGYERSAEYNFYVTGNQTDIAEEVRADVADTEAVEALAEERLGGAPEERDVDQYIGGYQDGFELGVDGDELGVDCDEAEDALARMLDE